MSAPAAAPSPSYPSRDQLLAGLLTALREDGGGGALVYGGRGLGKTALAQRMLDAPGDGPAPVLIVPTPALREVPYGALAPLLGGAAPSDPVSPLAVLRVVLSSLRGRSAGRGSVVVVDDLHLLDRESTILLTQLVGNRALQVVGFAPSPTALPADVLALAREGLLGQWVLGPLTDLDVDLLCSTLLGPHVARGVGSRLRARAGASPLFLEPILDEAVGDGSLRAVDGVWVLEDTELAVPAGVTRGVSLMTGELRRAERTALELTALAGMITPEDLVRVSGATVASLLHDGLLGAVSVGNGVYLENRLVPGHILRTTVPPGRSVTLLRELPAVTADDGTVPARARIRRALWELECGEPVPDDRRLALAELALWNADPRAALELVDGIRTPDHLAVAALYRSTALRALGRPERAWAAVPDGAAGASWWPSLPATDHRFLLERARSSNLAGRYCETIGSLQHLPVGEGDGTARDARLRATAHALLAEALGAIGRSVEARTHSSAALELVDHRPELLADLRGPIFLRHVGVLVHSGDLAAAAEALEDHAPGSEPDYAFCSGGLAVLDAAIDVRRGQFRKALATIRPALVSLRRVDHDALLPYALGIGAWAAAALGDVDQAERWSAEFHAAVSSGAVQSALLGAALVDAARILLAPASTTAQLMERARTARQRGWHTAEKDILELAVVLGDERSPALLAEVAAGLEGVEAAVLRAYAEGLVSRDATVLASTADRADLLHKYLLAAQATCLAMELYAGDRDEGSRRSLGPVARRRRARIDGVLVLGPEDPRSAPTLTPREREIALLAVDGLSNRAIAQHLVVSTRTVEGHLYRIFAKLDIARREDLAASLQEFLRGA